MPRILATLTVLLLLATSCFAGGGGESIVAELNGWTLTLDSRDGSSAYISKPHGDQQLSARINFTQFWDYLLVAKKLPPTTRNQKSPFKIVEDDAPKQRVTYLAPEFARPIIELMLLNHRTALSSRDAALIEAELNKNPPIDLALLPNGNFVFKVTVRD